MTRKKRFPVRSLVPESASIHGVLFKNRTAKVPLNIYWSFCVDFKPIEFMGETMQCSLMCEWVKLPHVRDWRELSIVDLLGGPADFDSTFYTVEHDPATSTHITISKRRATSFQLSWRSIIDYPGFSGEDADPALKVNAQCRAKFDGIYITEQFRGTKKVQKAKAMSVLEKFVDVKAFSGIHDRPPPPGFGFAGLVLEP